MTGTKIQFPPLDQLDEYERELYESTDVADRTALLIRLALKNVGVDPDSNDWYISGWRFGATDSNSTNLIKVEEQKIYYRPVVQNQNKESE